MSKIPEGERKTEAIIIKAIFFSLYTGLLINAGFMMYENVHSEGWIQHKFCSDWIPESYFRGTDWEKNVSTKGGLNLTPFLEDEQWDSLTE